MSIDDCYARISALESELSSVKARLKNLEELLDDKDHDLFEQWFKRFLDDKCNGGW